MTDPATPLHMGALHPLEQLIVLAVAFGPFLVLFVVVYVARKRALAEEAADLERAESAQPGSAEDNEKTG